MCIFWRNRDRREDEILVALADIVELLRTNQCKLGRIMATLDEILAETKRGTTVTQSVLSLIQTLAETPAVDQAKMDEAYAEMTANNDSLQAAVDANTPAPEPEPEPEPEPTPEPEPEFGNGDNGEFV